MIVYMKVSSDLLWMLLHNNEVKKTFCSYIRTAVFEEICSCSIQNIHKKEKYERDPLPLEYSILNAYVNIKSQKRDILLEEFINIKCVKYCCEY
jgi:hypothetical protein